MDTTEGGRQLALLEDRYHEIHRYALDLHARLAAIIEGDEASSEELYLRQEELAEAERDKRAILHAIEEIEERLLD